MPRKNAKKRPAKSASSPTAQRLQRVLASAGFGSRRQCEELIEDGRIHIDGVVVDKLGTTVDPDVSKILVDGVALRKQKTVYYAVNKPVGVVTTNRDPQGRPRVVDLVPPDERVFPVGRLDLSSEGLILLTNDGELSQKLTHPSIGVRKVYRVVVAGKVENETMKKMREGMYIAEGFVQVDGAKLVKARSRATELEITLSEGKNREIRRILARLGHKVQQLRRIAVGPLRLGDVPPGAYRVLRREEVDKLWAAVEAAEKESASRPAKKKTSSSAAKNRSVKKKFPTASSGPSTRGPATKKSATRTSGPRSSAAKSDGNKKATRKPTRAAAGEAPTSFQLPAKSSTGGMVIGGDSKPIVDKTKQKDHVVKPRPKGVKRKSATGGDSDSRSGAGQSGAGKTGAGKRRTGRGFKGKPASGRPNNQRRTKKR